MASSIDNSSSRRSRRRSAQRKAATASTPASSDLISSAEAPADSAAMREPEARSVASHEPSADLSAEASAEFSAEASAPDRQRHDGQRHDGQRHDGQRHDGEEALVTDGKAKAASDAGARSPHRKPDHEAGRESDRSWRDLTGNAPSIVGVGGALRARDVARPSEADLAAAERNLVIVRRQWQPPDGELPIRRTHHDR
ncbi:hypothetical protein ACSMXN_09660 [Jatrophihabitans sp. DSM 45814]